MAVSQHLNMLQTQEKQEIRMSLKATECSLEIYNLHKSKAGIVVLNNGSFGLLVTWCQSNDSFLFKDDVTIDVWNSAAFE